jgi:hypothetical protein
MPVFLFAVLRQEKWCVFDEVYAKAVHFASRRP